MRTHVYVFSMPTLFCALCVLPSVAWAIAYVDSDAPGPVHDGSSWTNAYTDLQLALSAAVANDEIWVAKGTYKPTSGSDRTATFQLKSGVKLYGGFPGLPGQEGNFSVRNVTANETILSGDIGMPGAPSDNCYHVVTASDTDETAVLDGFTVTNGNANGSSTPHNRGGGMYSSSGSPTLTDCTFRSNSAVTGGGMNNDQSSPTLTDCTFADNSATVGAGGMSNWNYSYPTLANCTFIANVAVNWAGGMYNRKSYPKLTNCTFIANSTDGEGGGFYVDLGSSILANCIFSGNSAGTGGAMYVWYQSSLTVNNCTFATNASPNGRAMACDSQDNQLPSTVEMANCILWDGGDEIRNRDDSTISITYSDVQGGTGEPWFGEGCIDADPRFVRTPDVGSDDEWGTADDDYGDLRLQFGAPCIDAGDNDAVPSGIALDLTGWDRFIDDPFTDPDPGNPGTLGQPVVDMGAYEFFFVDLDYDGNVDQDDLAIWESCASAPAVPVTPGCEKADFDRDGDAEQSDFAIFQRCYSGENVLANPNCGK